MRLPIGFTDFEAIAYKIRLMQEILHCVQDDTLDIRHPERSEGLGTPLRGDLE